MFSTLLGPLPPDPDRAAAPEDAGASAVDDVVADVVALGATGLELVSDGAPPARPDASTDDVVARWLAASAVGAAPVKAVLLGPYSAARDGAGDIDAIAERQRAAVLALAAAGCALIEIAEPSAGAIAHDDAEGRRFAAGHRRLLDGIDGVHCSLAVTGASVDGVSPAVLFDLPYASYAFDLIDGPDNWRLIAQAPADRGIVCGALGMAPGTDRTKEPLIWAAHYAASTNGRGLARIGLANAPATPATTRADALRRLAILAEASRIAAVESAEELASLLDPRAIDPRSAAFGRFAPDRRRRRP